MAKFQPRPPRQQKLLDPAENISRQWDQWLAKVENQLSALGGLPAPATSASAGIPPQFAVDANFLYICIAVNSWKRIPLVAF